MMVDRMDETVPLPRRSAEEMRERREMFVIHPDILGAGTPMPRVVERGAQPQDPAR